MIVLWKEYNYYKSHAVYIILSLDKQGEYSLFLQLIDHYLVLNVHVSGKF